MTITTQDAASRRGGMLARIGSWLAGSQPRSGRDGASLEHFNDHLLRDIGMQPHPSRQKRRLLMRL